MAAHPAFTRAELEAAFRLVLPTEVAKNAAATWWRRFADNVDERGFLLYDPPSEQLEPRVGAHAAPPAGSKQRAQSREFWGSMSEAERLELLMRFSSFHFGLVGLLSDDIHERLRLAQGLTPAQAESQRAQMRDIVAAMR
jgi:hypothetical protein